MFSGSMPRNQRRAGHNRSQILGTPAYVTQYNTVTTAVALEGDDSGENGKC